PGVRQLEPVDRRRSGEGSASVRGSAAPAARGVGLAQQGREQRLAPERVVVVHVLVAEREAEDPLPDDLPDIVLDATAVAVVHETLREALDDAPAALDPAEQQHPGVRSDLATV